MWRGEGRVIEFGYGSTHSTELEINKSCYGISWISQQLSVDKGNLVLINFGYGFRCLPPTIFFGGGGKREGVELAFFLIVAKHSWREIYVSEQQ